MSTQPIVLVDTQAALEQALQTLAPSEFIALDTEFMRESTYYPKLCLVQLASLEHCVLVDPLALADLEPLWAFLTDRSRLKVLHAARQDLEVLAARAPHAVPLAPLFDTQIAAALLGESAQIGYGALVSARLGTALAKGHTRTDWTRRPLSAEQLDYAADDVQYLAALYLDLRAELERAGKLAWLEQEADELARIETFRIEPEQAWKRLKGLDRLRPEQRATAKLLAAWREELAIKYDKPRGWILSDEALREISERMPKNVQALSRLRSLPEGLIRKRGEELVEIVARGEQTKATEPQAARPFRPEPTQLALVAKLMDFVRSHANSLKVSPQLLATRRDVEQLVFSGRTERLMQGWRRDAVGERLLALARAEGVATESAD
jgi:ribonuclease D